MRIIALGISSTAQLDLRLDLKPDGGSTVHEADPELVARVPALLYSLIAPHSCGLDVLVRLTRGDPGCRWYCIGRIGGHQFRIARRVDPDSCELQASRGGEDEPRRVATGAPEVQRRLWRALGVDSERELAGGALSLWDFCGSASRQDDHPGDPGLSLTGGGAGDEDSGELFGPELGVDEGDERGVVGGDDEEEVTEVGLELSLDEASSSAAPLMMERALYRRSATMALAEDFKRRLLNGVELAEDKLGTLVDEGGEFTRIRRELAALKGIRELSAMEEQLLREGEGRVAELRRRIELSEADGAGAERSDESPESLFRSPWLVGLVAVVLTLTVVGLLVSSRLLLVNLLAAPLAAWLALRQIRRNERADARSRLRDDRVARATGFREEIEKITRRLAGLRDELGVTTHEQWREAIARRRDLEVAAEEWESRSEEVLQSSEARELQRMSARFRDGVERVNRLIAGYGDDVVGDVHELERALREQGLVPSAVMMEGAWSSSVDHVLHALAAEVEGSARDEEPVVFEEPQAAASQLVELLSPSRLWPPEELERLSLCDEQTEMLGVLRALVAEDRVREQVMCDAIRIVCRRSRVLGASERGLGFVVIARPCPGSSEAAEAVGVQSGALVDEDGGLQVVELRGAT